MNDILSYVKDYLVFKSANELASEFYPIVFDDERKPDREKLIDFKDVVRKMIKDGDPKGELKSFITYMNPKRKWLWNDNESLYVVYRLKPKYHRFVELVTCGDIRLAEDESGMIYKFLFFNGIYSQDVLRFLFEVYELPLEVVNEPFGAVSRKRYKVDEVEGARELITETMENEKSKSKAKAKEKTSLKPKAAVDSKATAKSKEVSKSKAVPKSKSAAKPKAAADSKATAKSKATTKSKTVTKSKSTAKSKTTPKPKAAAKPKTETKTKATKKTARSK